MADSNSGELYTQIVENLKQVYDPEISINIYDLGLIYDINTDNFPMIKVTHTLTSAFCPAADQIIDDIRWATIAVDGVDECEVITTFDPPFGPWNMSEDAKLILGVFD
tara:strand:+ start:521 stop:844 length:324 start_codon:yes stop_codon:yes gene_type:complete